MSQEWDNFKQQVVASQTAPMEILKHRRKESDMGGRVVKVYIFSMFMHLLLYSNCDFWGTGMVGL